MADKKYVEKLELRENPGIRLPVMFLVDTSGSMGEKYDDVPLIDTLVDGVNTFFKAILNDENTKYSVDLGIITFSEEVEVTRQFLNLKEGEVFKRPNVGGRTSLGAAVNLGLDMLEDKKNLYKDEGIPYYQPWLVFFTDGLPTDEVAAAQERALRLQNEKKLVVFPLLLDDSLPTEELTGFSNSGAIINLAKHHLGEFFEFLNQSAKKATEGGDVDITKWSV